MIYYDGDDHDDLKAPKDVDPPKLVARVADADKGHESDGKKKPSSWMQCWRYPMRDYWRGIYYFY